MKELKSEMRCLPGIERSVEHLKQSMTKMLQSIEEIEKTVAALNLPKGAMNRIVDGDGFEVFWRLKFLRSFQRGNQENSRKITDEL